MSCHCDFVQNRSQMKDEASARQEKRNNFLLPYVNLEDLSINNGTQWLVPQSGGVERYHGFSCTMVTFGDETTYGRVLEYSERLDESDKDSPDGAMMEFILQESMTFGNGLAVLETQEKLALWLQNPANFAELFRGVLLPNSLQKSVKVTQNQ
ncbi:hypothetical protein B0H14DRAFT_3543552 [Mycena olivaceomarginata]|nr:hypothetical protein B0H14DRAFT_3543552 [Mycena olivaceomarginata]